MPLPATRSSPVVADYQDNLVKERLALTSLGFFQVLSEAISVVWMNMSESLAQVLGSRRVPECLTRPLRVAKDVVEGIEIVVPLVVAQ